MLSFDLADKRSQNGTLLRYETSYITDDIADKCIQEIKQLRTYKSLSNEFNGSEKIELYFKKFFCEEVYDLANQISLIYWDERNNALLRSHIINIPFSPFSNLYKELIVPYLENVRGDISIIHSRNQRINKIISRRNLSKIYRSVFFILANIMRYFRFFSFYKEREVNQKFTTIALNYVEGLDQSKRSDVFWYPFSHIPPSNVLVYFESKYLMSLYGSSKIAIKKIEDYNFRWQKVFNVHYYMHKASSDINKIYKNIRRKIDFVSQNKSNSYLVSEKDFRIKCFEIINLIQSWHCFFSNYCVKIHFDPREGGLDVILKAIAIEMSGGVSVGKERSFLVDAKTAPKQIIMQNDLFFTWGKESAIRLLESSDTQNNIIISGNPYDKNFTDDSEYSPDTVKRKIINNGANLTVLLLDNMHSYNNGQFQVIYTPSMEEFYRCFLEWVIEERDLGLIIKSKKPVVQETLPGIKTLINQAENTCRCYNIPDPFQTKPADFAAVSDIVVSIGTFLSGALIESVLKGVRGVFYDNPNLRSIEKGLYAWGDKKVIFSNLREMMDALKSFKKNTNNFPDLGDWSAHLDKLDPFRDMRGAERIGTYVRWLKESFDKGLERKDAIEQANEFYAKEWGEEKIISTKFVNAN